MRVLQINASYKPAYIYGGPTMSVAMLCEQLVKAGVGVNVFTTTANGLVELDINAQQPEVVDGVNVFYFKRITGDHTHFSPALLFRLWKEAKKYDLVHIHAWWNLVSVLSCLVAVFQKVPVVVSPRGTLSAYSFSNKNQGVKKAIHHFLGSPLLHKCHVHVTSAYEKLAIAKLVQPKSITVVPNMVKLPPRQIKRETVPAACLKLLFFSRIEEKKGLDLLLNALPLIQIPCFLTIAGTGDENYITFLKGIAAKNNIADKINWAGFYSDNKFDLLREHDLFVLPSHDENFGNSVIESLSAGTAVLISRHVGLAGYVEENNLGWLCETTPQSISRCITNAGTVEKDRLRAIRKDAPDIIYSDFCPESLVGAYISMYQNSVKKNR